jgi:hypothetical protein
MGYGLAGGYAMTWEDEALCSLINALDQLGAFRESASPYVAECALKALAPHLAARDAAVRRAALEEAATAVELWNADGADIRALAMEATPDPSSMTPEVIARVRDFVASVSGLTGYEPITTEAKEILRLLEGGTP